MLYISTYIWNLYNGIDDPVYKAEIETQIQRTNACTPRKEGGWGDLETGIDRYTLLTTVN